MTGKGLLKRLLPFFATFAFGLLVASFFVSVAAPNLTFRRSWQKDKDYRGCRLMERQSRREERRFKKMKAEREARQNTEFNGDIYELVPPPPPLPPAPRAAR